MSKASPSPKPTPAVSTPPPPPNGASANEPAASTPVAIGGGNSRKGSLMVGGNGDMLPRGNLAFGTVDSPNTLLSSSPAAPSTTGGHLADAVKSFGSIDAETTAAGASMIRPPRRTSGGANPATPGHPQKQLDVHSLFAGKGPNPYQQQMSGMPNQQHVRPPPGQPRSPVMGHAQPPQFGGQMPNTPQSFRVPQQQMAGGNQPPVRPSGVNGPMVPRPMMGQQNINYGGMQHQAYPGMMYPGQAPYYYNPYEQGYGMPQQWVPQHAQQHPSNIPLSPRSAQAQLQPSPAPPSATLPGSAGGSPMPTPPSRPQSLVGGHAPTPSNSSPMPTTPSRPLQPGTPFTPHTPGSQGPQTPGSLSAGAATFTPGGSMSAGSASFPARTKQTIKISRPDGTSLNLAEAAAAAKGPTSSSTSGVATPETAASGDEPPKKKMPTLPVIVRLESEEQKKARLAEEEKRKKIKEEEDKEERERKERQERRAKEDAERQAKEEAERKAKDEEEQSKKVAQEKEDAEKAEKAKQDAEKAQADAEAKSKAAKEEEEAKKAAEEEASKKAKAAEEEEANKAKEAPKTPEPASTPVDKVEELRQALFTPSTSAAASPLASPALAAAGLPAKPVSAINGSRRPTPSALDIKGATTSASGSTSNTPSALSKAKAIEDITAVEYPSSIKPMNANLNEKSEPGKFRYDRDFLMQFMEVCKAKPDSLPPLEEIGLEAGSADSGFGRGTRISSSRGTSRNPSTLNLPMGGRPFNSGMGSFSTSGTTSQDRYNRSLMNPRIGSSGGMARVGSSGGSLPPMHNLPNLGSRNANRSSNRGQRRAPPPPAHDPDVAPLAVTANAWVNARSAGSDEKSPVYIERKVKALLNKLTEEKFDSISTQILEWANKSRDETDGMTLKLVIKLVFEKSTDEAHWSAMYAKLCRLLLDRLDPAVTEVIDGKSVSGGSLFRKYLLGRCQADFEAGWKAREEAALAATAKSAEDAAKMEANKESGSDEPTMMSDEYYAAQKAKRRGLGLIQLIGELYKLEMLSKSVIRECLVRLLGNVDNPDEEDLESTCKLLTTVGKQFEATSSKPMDVVFERLDALTKMENVSSRIKFMIMDVIDLRRNRWQSRKESVPTTIAQIHQMAARENAEKAQAARESISRGGSRAGHSRRDAPQPGEWQSVAASSRPPQRPTDFSNLGRGVSSAGLPSNPTFGPSGIFASRNKKGSAAGSTPPLSRHSSTTNMSNMFGILNETGDSTSTEPAEAAPQRKKLQLAPRTKPLEADGDDDENQSDEGEAEEESESAPSMSADAAEKKIANDLKELWGEKDQGGSRNPDDIVEYYNALPQQFRGLLSEKLAEDVFRIAKYRDAEVVAKGWAAVLKGSAATTDDLKKGLAARMPSLDDDSIDFPQAFKAIAVLVRSLDLGQEDIDALTEKIEVYGEPRITPKQKLERALAQVDEEKAASA